ncbi:hypothetical protein [Lactobacillus acetotolerans]|uniref:hypothetical protein n=1 Tax=Lactobacillus acetotolerans TaxID=1600 RepID=UPI002FD884DA
MKYTRTDVSKISTSVEHSLITEATYKADMYSFSKAKEFGDKVTINKGDAKTVVITPTRTIYYSKVYQFGQD